MNQLSFLPENFDSTASIALLAGKGDYPRLVWEQLKKHGGRHYLFAFEDSDWVSSVNEDCCFHFSIGQVGTWLKALKNCHARYAILAGQVTPKKLFHGLKPDLKAILLLAKLKEKNATTIFKSLIQEVEKLDVKVLDARCFLENQLADLGDITSNVKVKIDPENLNHGIEVCRQIAALNIGQSIIVHQGTTIIVEAFDGTDAMIRRSGEICHRPMGLIKLAKEDQDFRFDVPVFGMHTLHEMHNAGIHWAALEAERTLILNKSEVIKEAERLKIRLLGIK